MYIVLIYFLILSIVFFLLYKIRFVYNLIPKLCMTKYGLIFHSNKRHRIRVGEVKLLILNNTVYLKRNNRTVVIKSIDRVFLKSGYLYFRALGEVKIIFNCKSFYKYFNILIKSDEFDFNEIKNRALYDMVDYLFSLNECKSLISFLNIVHRILNISINDKNVIVKKNKYNISFSLIYKVNNQLKKININETF